MSIVKSYRDQFRIYIFDRDYGRCESFGEILRQAQYQFACFSDPERLEAGLRSQIPHMLVLFYQPLNVEFRTLLKTVRELSEEIEIVVLGSGDFGQESKIYLMPI